MGRCPILEYTHCLTYLLVIISRGYYTYLSNISQSNIQSSQKSVCSTVTKIKCMEISKKYLKIIIFHNNMIESLRNNCYFYDFVKISVNSRMPRCLKWLRFVETPVILGFCALRRKCLFVTISSGVSLS